MFIQASVGGHLDCFHLQANVNNTSVDTFVQVLVWTDVLISRTYTENGVPGSYV